MRQSVAFVFVPLVPDVVGPLVLTVVTALDPAPHVLVTKRDMPKPIDAAHRDLVVANRILAREGILDALGHVSVRHPEDPQRFIMSWARAPELVETEDLLEFGLDGEPLDAKGRFPYRERYIHAAAYAERPDVMSVCHNHAASILPFGISRTARLRPVIHSAAALGGEAPVWDIADEFGPNTNLLVVNMQQGHSLARTLGAGRIVLMRGHGSVVVGLSIPAVVSACINMDKNAKVQLQAMQLGEYIPLTPGEIDRPSIEPGRLDMPDRGWEAYVRRVTGLR
jgi:HCOMODA/2-hydroxy-3-carboxy-muconic semialdehyde decarboxylase